MLKALLMTSCLACCILVTTARPGHSSDIEEAEGNAPRLNLRYEGRMHSQTGFKSDAAVAGLEFWKSRDGQMTAGVEARHERLQNPQYGIDRRDTNVGINVKGTF